jgi:hypothetical protein
MEQPCMDIPQYELRKDKERKITKQDPPQPLNFKSVCKKESIRISDKVNLIVLIKITN